MLAAAAPPDTLSRDVFEKFFGVKKIDKEIIKWEYQVSV